MGKIATILIILLLHTEADSLQKSCLSCHEKQLIPTRLIYKRYLLKYSTNQRMHDAIFTYLKNPTQKSSIMPPQFFLKFPMKKNTRLDDQSLHRMIDLFLVRYDIKKRLVVK